jgi:hypothetical protein
VKKPKGAAVVFQNTGALAEAIRELQLVVQQARWVPDARLVGRQR